MSDNVKVLLIGAGRMAEFYCEVFKGMNIQPMIVGKSEENAGRLSEKTGYDVIAGGIEKAYDTLPEVPTHVIIATGVETLKQVTEFILSKGIRNILLEKPAGLNLDELISLEKTVEEAGANVFVAYNRRYYASVEKAQEIIAQDGGITSINYEFTEWSHTVVAGKQPACVKENWMLANSTHVIDLAFYLAGAPKELSAYTSGSLEWHPSAAAFGGAGITERNVLFTYQANWAAPGRWAVEVLTPHHRLYFKPMEQLAIQELASVKVVPVEFDDSIDQKFKPGLYNQVKAFLEDIEDGKRIRLEEHVRNARWYQVMEGFE